MDKVGEFHMRRIYRFVVDKQNQFEVDLIRAQ